MKSLILCLLSSFFCYSQTKTDTLVSEKSSNVYTIRYNKLKDLYLKQLDSKSYKVLDSLTYSFITKLHISGTPHEVGTVIPLEWAKANIKKTDFKNFKEAKKEWAAIEAAKEIEAQEYSEYHDYVFESIMATSSPDIDINSMEDVRMEHPEKFRQPKCANFKG